MTSKLISFNIGRDEASENLKLTYDEHHVDFVTLYFNF